MKIAIHQPESFPWAGFFHKMYLADVFVILDTVQFKREDVQNRNKIKVANKSAWLTVPVERAPLDTLIKDVRINWDDPIIRKHLTTLENNYKKHPYFNELYPAIKKIYEDKPENLSDFNTQIILLIKDKLGIPTKILRASELSLSGNAKGGTEVTLEICKVLGSTIYISGSGAKVYLDCKKYDDENIKVYFPEFKYPTYKQIGDEFISHLSILDMYFNHGPRTLEIILNDNIKEVNI